MKNNNVNQIVYQIYPRSFYDSNADGVGDIQGIIKKIDYLVTLGIDAVWLSPIYPSPMIDFGYDIADYCDIDPLFGKLSDFDRLIDELHKKNIKLYLDFVPNHTSSTHPWFKDSRSSRTSSKRDWYIWADPAPDGSPPNNWLAYFGGSAWEYDEGTKQYYYHAFDKEQPDLNWHNPHVKNAMFEVFSFWLKKGVDGFRIDATSYLFENPSLENEPQNPQFDQTKQSHYRSLLHTQTVNRPETLSLLKELAAYLKEQNTEFLVTESPSGEPLNAMLDLYQTVQWRKYMPFNFSFIKLPWNAQQHKDFIDSYDAALGDTYIPNYVLGNHDRPRIASRIGVEQARIAAMLQLTLRGTAFIYNGDEIGMTNTPIPPELAVDTFELRSPGKGLGRDPERTPLQWNTDAHAGFTTSSQPWLPLNPNYLDINIETEEKNSTSVLSLYKALISLRKNHPALLYGEYVPHPSPAKNVLAYLRRYHDQNLLIVLNYDDQDKTISLPYTKAQILIATSMTQSTTTRRSLENFRLGGNQGYIFTLNSEER